MQFETDESIRVSMVPRQKSCLAGDSCSAFTGYQCGADSTDWAFLELETSIDVPVNDANTYSFTGPANISTLTEATSGGCHYAAGAGAIVYRADFISAGSIQRTENGVSKTFARTTFYLRTPCLSAKKNDDTIVNNIFSTCPSDSSKNSNYDFKVQMASCKTEAALQQCARGEGCGDCVLIGNRQELTVVKADVLFVEQLPSVNLGKKTAMSLVSQLSKYGSDKEIDYASSAASFTVKDTLVLGIRPQDGTSFQDPQFSLTCDEKCVLCITPQRLSYSPSARAGTLPHIIQSVSIVLLHKPLHGRTSCPRVYPCRPARKLLATAARLATSVRLTSRLRSTNRAFCLTEPRKCAFVKTRRTSSTRTMLPCSTTLAQCGWVRRVVLLLVHTLCL